MSAPAGAHMSLPQKDITMIARTATERAQRDSTKLGAIQTASGLEVRIGEDGRVAIFAPINGRMMEVTEVTSITVRTNDGVSHSFSPKDYE